MLHRSSLCEHNINIDSPEVTATEGWAQAPARAWLPQGPAECPAFWARGLVPSARTQAPPALERLSWFTGDLQAALEEYRGSTRMASTDGSGGMHT